MDITFVNGDNSWKFYDDEHCEKGVTDRRTTWRTGGLKCSYQLFNWELLCLPAVTVIAAVYVVVKLMHVFSIPCQSLFWSLLYNFCLFFVFCSHNSLFSHSLILSTNIYELIFPWPIAKSANWYTRSLVIMSAMASQITGVSIACSTVWSGAHQRKHQSSASLAFVRGIHRWPVDSPHKGPVTLKMFPFDDVIMWLSDHISSSFYKSYCHRDTYFYWRTLW